ncbi:putative MFS transporter [Nitrospirillum bahiense]|uniref:Putative MFS transporter n=1 Tax=Nitrospirillum amazonense TaxID=28077 RepID=A0A560G1Q9_9PROT|nr:putative MFS transporter [Nitrospirillum amazonense]
MASLFETGPGDGDRVLADRRAVLAFWVGCAVVTVGVVLHLPMFLMAKDVGYRLADMPMDMGMTIGMGLIIVGVLIAAYGLLPRKTAVAAIDLAVVHDDGPLRAAHWRLMAVIVVALVIDVMKPASLGFVLPGMREEYGVDKMTVAWLPMAALAGTVVGSLIWGALADVYGRRASILLSSVMFVGTSICGAMPDFWWNVAMCFLMGAAAGGMLPVAYALLAETMPLRHRGWNLVLVGGLGGIGGYLAASGLSALLQPLYGWRIMWLLNLPTGLILVFLNGQIPESPHFLLLRGRLREAERTLARFGAALTREAEGAPASKGGETHFLSGRTLALTVTALAWSFTNFGLLLWLPAELTARGMDVVVSSRLLAASALIACPTIAVAALLYFRWSTKWTLALMIVVAIAGLAGVMRLGDGAGLLDVVAPVALLIVGSNGILAVLLPYTAENYAVGLRGRATGWVAGCSKAGGLVTQCLAIAALVPGLGTLALAICGLMVAALLLVIYFGSETRVGRRDADPPPTAAAAETSGA